VPAQDFVGAGLRPARFWHKLMFMQGGSETRPYKYQTARGR
jgi:hypothetical protein